jgi:hypothetical protein
MHLQFHCLMSMSAAGRHIDAPAEPSKANVPKPQVCSTLNSHLCCLSGSLNCLHDTLLCCVQEASAADPAVPSEAQRVSASLHAAQADPVLAYQMATYASGDERWIARVSDPDGFKRLCGRYGGYIPDIIRVFERQRFNPRESQLLSIMNVHVVKGARLSVRRHGRGGV